MRPMNRRDFLLDSGKYAAALSAAGLLGGRSAADVQAAAVTNAGSPSDQIRFAVIGVKGRGVNHVDGIAGRNNCVVATVCDCDEAAITRAMNNSEKKQGKLPKYEKDLRKVLDDPNIDAVSIATPNHWHALAAIWALQAGKHVYVEKPVSHNVWEGGKIVEAARKYNKICQTGTQIRSMPGIREAMAFLHAGKLGKVKLAVGTCYKARPSIGKVKGDGEVPATIDYDLWCGPGPKRPPRRQKLHYDWHWQWDYGNGDLGNQGIHQMDVARWGLNKDTMPNSVVSLGGRFGYEDDGETANTQICIFDYGDSELIFEVRGLMTKDYLSERRGKATTDKRLNTVPTGNIFYGEKGVLVCSSYTDAIALDNDDNVIQVFGGRDQNNHFGNFAKAVRSGKREELTADIAEGHLSSALCHLGNVSYRLGREVPFDSREAQTVVRERTGTTDDAGTEALQRMRKHLEANGVSLGKAQCRVGLSLDLDPKTEQFVGHAAANKMLRREYRKGFEVPEKV
jgi:predicted dehydrogenase